MKLSKEDKAQLREIQQLAIERAREDGGLMLFMGYGGKGLCFTCIQCKRNHHPTEDPGVGNLRCPVCEPAAPAG